RFGDLQHLLDGRSQRRGHLAVAAVALPGLLRLAATGARPQSGHGLEVRREHDSPPAARDLADLPVHDALGLDRADPPRRVAVVDDHVRDAAGVGDPREERHVPLASALEYENALLVGIDAERVEDERERELLGPSLDEDGAPREEQLSAVAVDLRQSPERPGLRERLRLKE